MRDLRARIAQRHGIDLSQEQLQELAARRLEAILDPRTVKPALLEELRRGAAAGQGNDVAQAAAGYDFTEATLYESHRGIIRVLRRILNPILMLFINPSSIARALSAQSRINQEAAERAAEQLQRQSEWNALHFDILQRLVTEVARVSLEVQALSARVESLVARVDFNDKRVRSLENLPAPSSRGNKPAEQSDTPLLQGAPAAEGNGEAGGDAVRRKRRRRRSRRPGGPWPEGSAQPGVASETAGDEADRVEDDDASDEEPESIEGVEAAIQGTDQPSAIEPIPASTGAPAAESPAKEPQESTGARSPGEPSTLDR